MKNIIIFGGSFNPPHIGHFEMMSYLFSKLHPNGIWMVLTSDNQVYKKDSKLESFHHRTEMAKILHEDYPHLPIIFSDIECRMGNENQGSYSVLKKLHKENSHTHFIWEMGIDNVKNFDQWQDYQKIIEEFPIAILNRAGTTEKLLKNSIFTKDYSHLRLKDYHDLLQKNNGWYFFEGFHQPYSSTDIRHDVAQGKNPCQINSKVLEYIKICNLYKQSYT